MLLLCFILILHFFQTLVEETLIKEELVDEESNSEVPDTGLNYGTLVSEVGVDSNEAGEDQSKLMLSARYNEQCHDQSFLQHHFQQSENSLEAQSGPALLQVVGLFCIFYLLVFDCPSLLFVFVY